MKRRSCLKVLLGTVGIMATRAANGAPAAAAEGQRPIDSTWISLSIPPGKRRCCVSSRANSGQRHRGNRDLSPSRCSNDSTLRGPAPAGCNYQFVLSFASEDLRQKWVATPIHKATWPKIESTFTSPNYSRLLYEVY